MPQTTILFVHLQYDAPDSPRVARSAPGGCGHAYPPCRCIWSGATHDDFDTDSLPLAVTQAVRATHQARTDTAMAGQLQAHVAALAAAQIPVTPLLRAGAPRKVLAQVASELDAALVLVGTPEAPPGALRLPWEAPTRRCRQPCPARCAALSPQRHTPAGGGTRAAAPTHCPGTRSDRAEPGLYP